MELIMLVVEELVVIKHLHLLYQLLIHTLLLLVQEEMAELMVLMAHKVLIQ